MPNGKGFATSRGMQGSESSAARLSAAVMTKNSMETLPACLQSLEFCDEIVVMDDFSEDGTWEYVQSLAPKVRGVQRRLDNFANQRRTMCSHVATDWVLVVDADEEALPGMGEEILTRLSSGESVTAYHVPQKNILPQHWPRPIHFWTSQKRLLNLRDVHWAESEWVHVPALHSGPSGRLNKGLMHHSYDSMMHLFKKQLYYGESGGRHFHGQGKTVSLPRTVVRMVAAFLKYYVSKGLFRFGFGGFSVAFAFTFYTFAKSAFLWEYNSGEASAERSVVPGENLRTPSGA